MLHPRINGIWLTDIGSFGEVTYSEDLLHGCQSASWSMAPGTRHPLLRSGSQVVIYEGSIPLWSGLLSEPAGDGSFSAFGAHNRGVGVLAIDGGGLATNVPQTAVDAAIARGAVPWKRVAPMSTDPVGELDALLMLNALLDRSSENGAAQWRVNHLGQVEAITPAIKPRWSVLLAADRASTSDDDYVTHLNVIYQVSPGVLSQFTYITPDSAVAADRWGWQEALLDLTGLGVITGTKANEYAAARMTATGPRLTLSEPLTLHPGQLCTIGGTAAGWAAVHPGQMVRMFGVPDRSRAVVHPYTDMVIGSLDRSATTLTLKPQGLPPQNAREVVAALVE